MAAVLDLWVCGGVTAKNNGSSCPWGLCSQNNNFKAEYQQKNSWDHLNACQCGMHVKLTTLWSLSQTPSWGQSEVTEKTVSPGQSARHGRHWSLGMTQLHLKINIVLNWPPCKCYFITTAWTVRATSVGCMQSPASGPLSLLWLISGKQ